MSDVMHLDEIRTGWAWNDARYGINWPWSVDLETLDINNCFRCVLGQLEHRLGDRVGLDEGWWFWTFCIEQAGDQDDYEWATERGFSGPDSLTIAWRERIQAWRVGNG
jgi:hypothetical protein